MSKNNSSSILGLLLILGLLGLSGYLWMSLSNLKTELANTKSQYLELEKVNTELDVNYQAKLEELEGLRGDNAELNTRKKNWVKRDKKWSTLMP